MGKKAREKVGELIYLSKKSALMREFLQNLGDLCPLQACVFHLIKRGRA
jgi:hypothetical protein